MKSISAAIVVLAAAVLLVGGAYVQHNDSRLFLQIVGCGVGLMGMRGWLVASKEN